MNLTTWRRPEPAPINGGFERLRDEMERTLERFFGKPWETFGSIEAKPTRNETWIPPMDVSETDNEVTIRTELPGIAANDLDISISGTTLTIAGQKRERQEKKDENVYHCECSYGSFRRMIQLPPSIEADKIRAESDNGVLTIRIARSPGSRTKRVEVKPTSKNVPVTG